LLALLLSVKTHLKCIYGVLLEISRDQHSRIENLREAMKEPTRQNFVHVNDLCVCVCVSYVSVTA